MRRKKITAVAFALILGISTMIPASASTLPTTESTYRNERFYVFRGGLTVVSSHGVRKGNTRNAMSISGINNSGTKWGSKDVLNVRGITLVNTQATVLGKMKNDLRSPGTAYLPGHGTANCHYGVRASFSQSSASPHLDVNIAWVP